MWFFSSSDVLALYRFLDVDPPFSDTAIWLNDQSPIRIAVESVFDPQMAHCVLVPQEIEGSTRAKTSTRQHGRFEGLLTAAKPNTGRVAGRQSFPEPEISPPNPVFLMVEMLGTSRARCPLAERIRLQIRTSVLILQTAIITRYRYCTRGGPLQVHPTVMISIPGKCAQNILADLWKNSGS